ncbi:MAG: portal protein [Burkholderiaceae bacterium]
MANDAQKTKDAQKAKDAEARIEAADIKAHANEAFENARKYHQELDDIYKFYMPFRKSTSEQAPERGGPSEGQSRTNEVFDGTGLSAAFNFAGTMQADWMPPFEDFFKLEPGPLIPEGDAKKQLSEELQKITQVVHGVLPRARVTAHEMMLDLFAGTGAMNMAAGEDAEPVRARAVPPSELALEEGPWGDIWHIWWRRNRKFRDLEELWPKGKFSDTLWRAMKEDRSAARRSVTSVTQYTYYDPKEKLWKLRVWSSHDAPEAFIWEEPFRTSRWVIPRFFKVPGETFGRGLAHLGLPFVKTANKTRELALRAAAFAILGIWMRRNDAVFNPDTAIFKPLAMWTVSSTGGPLGPTIQRLPVPQDFDVSSIVMQDERDQIRRVLLDDELPSEQDPVRSATEIAGRLRRYARNRGGTGSRIALELVTPIVRHTVEILEKTGKLPTNISIDQLLTQVTVTAPAAAAQRADKVDRAVSWIQMIVMLFGPQAAMLAAKVEELLPAMGRWLGVDETHIRSKAEAAQLQELMQQMVAAQANAEAQASTPPPDPGQQLVNGGAV